MPTFNPDLSLLGKRFYPDDDILPEVGVVDGPWIQGTPLRLAESPEWIRLPAGEVAPLPESCGIEVSYAFEQGSKSIFLEVAAGARLLGPLRYRHRTIAKTIRSPIKPLLGAIGVALAFGLVWRGLLPTLLESSTPSWLMQRSIQNALFAVAMAVAPLGICVAGAISAEKERRRRADFGKGVFRPLQVITRR